MHHRHRSAWVSATGQAWAAAGGVQGTPAPGGTTEWMGHFSEDARPQL